MNVLPIMYWTPKMHKTPSKARYIVAAAKCTNKALAKDITSVLKMFYRQIENYNAKMHKMSYIKNFWVVKNKDPVIEGLNYLSNKDKAKSIATYDFSTLYTKIPHNKLLSVLNEITDVCFYGCSYSKIWIEKGNAGWCNNPKTKTNKRIMDKAQIKNAITYLLDNCYFTVGDNVFKQVIGIPMGTDPAPFMANLFLYYYENKFMRELRKNDRKSAYKFSYVWRFIDDLSAVNNDNIFENNIPNIYPPELELKKENNGYMNASFLDLEIKYNEQEIDFILEKKNSGKNISFEKIAHD